jgi:hypothetical protein
MRIAQPLGGLGVRLIRYYRELHYLFSVFRAVQGSRRSPGNGFGFASALLRRVLKMPLGPCLFSDRGIAQRASATIEP